MTEDSVVSQVKSLEMQLSVLQGQMKHEVTSPKSPADLYGLLAGQVQSTDEDIDGAKYQIGWDDSQGAAQP